LDLQGEYLLGVKVNGDPAGSDFACLGGIGDVLEFRGGKLVADFQGSHCTAIDGWHGFSVEDVLCGVRESGDGGFENGWRRSTVESWRLGEKASFQPSADKLRS